MKRGILMLLLLTLACLIGCAGVTIATNDTAKIAGKAAGIYVATKYPAVSAIAVPYAKGLLQDAKYGKLSSDSMTAAIAALNSQIKSDAEWKVLLTALTSAITVEVQVGAVNAQAVSALEGFVEGLELA